MMNRLFNPASIATVAAGAVVLSLPMDGWMKWFAFGVILLVAAVLSAFVLSAGQASMAIGALMTIAAASAWFHYKASTEAALFLAAGTALMVASVGSLFLKGRALVAHGLSGKHMSATQPPLPTTGEVLAARYRARKAGLPAPRFITPSWENDFRSIVGMTEFKKKLRQAGLDSVGTKDRNGILLHGEPGDGKTSLAKALAGDLGLEFIPIHKKMSKWVGDAPQNLFDQLNEAIARTPCLIFFDEADSVFPCRGDATSGSLLTETNSMVNRLLTYLVDYRRSGVVFVAATNFIDAIDPAVKRAGRFDYVFEVPKPDLEARVGLLRASIAKNSTNVSVADGVVDSLSKRWNGFNSATILSVPTQIPQFVKDHQRTQLTFDDFMEMLRRQQGMANRVPESTKSFAEMSYPPQQAATIQGLIARVRRSFEMEESGGQAPSGVLFYGPTGTGKTETARMIAKETKWAFFAVHGSDLARDPDLIDKTIKKVQNARPAIIFIDEADDLLGDRSSNPYKAATNKLLAAMDGPNGKITDLLWIASTNFAEVSDEAVVRSGRFTEKVRFEKPGDAPLLAMAKAFFLDPKRNAVMDVSWEEVADVLTGSSIADAQGILMQAWNLTLTAKGGVDRGNPVIRESLEIAKSQLKIN